MSKHVMMSRSEFESWLRRFRVAVAAYVGFILLVGAVYVVAKLIGAEFAPVFFGLLAMIAGCALGAVAWGGLWLADLVFHQGEQLERQRERIAELDAGWQLHEAEAEAKAAGTIADASQAPSVPVDAYPRIAAAQVEPMAAAPPVEEIPARPTDDEDRFRAALDAGDLRAAGSLWRELNGHVSADRREELNARLDALRAQVATKLRGEFGALLRAENYSAALRKGDEIMDLLPASRMCTDFEVIRAHLEARANSA